MQAGMRKEAGRQVRRVERAGGGETESAQARAAWQEARQAQQAGGRYIWAK